MYYLSFKAKGVDFGFIHMLARYRKTNHRYRKNLHVFLNIYTEKQLTSRQV